MLPRVRTRYGVGVASNDITSIPSLLKICQIVQKFNGRRFTLAQAQTHTETHSHTHMHQPLTHSYTHTHTQTENMVIT
jgi:hypothetical protein